MISRITKLDLFFQKKANGFTLLEIVALLIIIGILSAVAIARVSDTGAEEAGEIELLKTNLRFAQTRSMSQGLDTVWGIRIESDKYILIEIENGNEEDSSFPFPASDSATHSFENINIVSETGSVEFDFLGRPSFDGTLLSSSREIVFSGGSTITITAETGFIQ